jgi:hypothetical protein
MVEPVTTLGLGAVFAYLGKDGLQKLLGPTAEYLGGGMRDFVKNRIENINNIFENAAKKLGSKIEEPGQVPPRVLKSIIDEGSYCDNKIAAEYFGGVLASSRTENGRDDRGARISRTIERLSIYQLRTHFIIYSNIKKMFAGKGISMNNEGRSKMQIFIPFIEYFSAMDFSNEEKLKLPSILPHCFFGLGSENLIEPTFYQYGLKASLSKYFAAVPSDGILCQPSAIGVELFLWAFGQANQPLDFIFSDTFLPIIEGVPTFLPNVLPVNQ